MASRIASPSAVCLAYPALDIARGNVGLSLVESRTRYQLGSHRMLSYIQSSMEHEDIPGPTQVYCKLYCKRVLKSGSFVVITIVSVRAGAHLDVLIGTFASGCQLGWPILAQGIPSRKGLLRVPYLSIQLQPFF